MASIYRIRSRLHSLFSTTTRQSLIHTHIRSHFLTLRLSVGGVTYNRQTFKNVVSSLAAPYSYLTDVTLIICGRASWLRMRRTISLVAYSFVLGGIGKVDSLEMNLTP